MTILKNYPLKDLNTFGINALADYFIPVSSDDHLLQLKNDIIIKQQKILILGGGSNILFKDNYKGLVLKSEIEGIREIKNDKDYVLLEAGSGVVWDDLVKYAVDNEYYGIENLSLIPGTVGAAPIQNIGAYGTELEEVFFNVEGFELDSFEKRVFTKADCQFGYRDSIFKKEMKNKFFITKLRLKLSKIKTLKISYRAIKEFIRENDINPGLLSIKDLRKIIVEIRMSKLPDPAKIGNAGSFFKNPVIDHERFLLLKEKFKDLVFFKTGKDEYKIPAGWLIEKCGYKGKRYDDAGVHAKQALVLVNFGSASGEDIVKLAENIRSAVAAKFQIELETEVNIV